MREVVDLSVINLGILFHALKAALLYNLVSNYGSSKITKEENMNNMGKALSTDIEGTYRRGFHQAIALVAEGMKSQRGLTAADLEKWVNGAGMKWRKDLPLTDIIIAPPFK